MAEYIEREAALEECDWYVNEFCECEYAIMPLKGALKNLPAADVRPVVRGKWISVNDGETIVRMTYGEPLESCRCSVCGEWLVGSDEYAVKGNFCPNCGADMREES